MDLGEWLQEELDSLALRIRRPVSIDDPNGRVIAYSAQDASVDPVRIAAILSRRVAPAVQRWEHEHRITDATGPVHLPPNPGLGMSARLCVPIRRGHSLLGYMWVLETGDTLNDAAMAAVSQFASHLADVLDRGPGSRMASSSGIGELIRQLLTVPPVPEAADQLVAAVPSLLATKIQVCAIIPTTTQRETVAELTGRDFLRLHISLPPSLRHLPRYIGSFVCTTHAVVLLRASSMPGSRAADPTILELDAVANADARSPGTAFTVGISEPTTLSGGAANDALRQALAAAELAALDPALPTPLHWNRLGAYRALLAPQPILDSTLTPLDQAGNSANMLIRTLETYLDLGGDAQETAHRLHLHRTTLYYRLSRITEVLQADLNDGLTRLELHLALKSRRASRRMRGSPGTVETFVMRILFRPRFSVAL